MFDEKLVTVWSAPNYCYRCGNIASIMVFKDVNTREPKLFRAVPDSERVIPPRTTTPYFLWGLRPSCWPVTFSALFLPQLSCITLYNILFIEHFAAEMLPLAFFYFKLSKFIVCYGVYNNVFLSVFSPIPSPSWTHLRRLEKCLNTHTAACSSCLFTGLGETRCVSFFKKPIDRTDYTEILLLYHSAFCFSLVSFKKFQQQSCYPVGTMDCKCLELCILVPAVNFIVLCWIF